MTIKMAGAYLRDGTIFLSKFAETDMKGWIGQGDPVLFNLDAPKSEIANHLLQALDSCQYDVPHPADFDAVDKPLLDAAGVETWKEFAITALSLDISEEDGNIIFIPMRRHSRQNFDFLTEKKIVVPRASRDQIATAFLKAWERCEG